MDSVENMETSGSLDEIVITQVFPCIADPAKVRFHAQPSSDLAGIFPYLNAVAPGAIYNHELPALTLSKEHRIITIYPRLVTGAKADNVEDARATLEWLRNLINETWARRLHIKPSFARRQRLGALEIYKLLPETNCGRCGALTCLAFAVGLAGQETTIARCTPLAEAQHPDKRALLCELLEAAGYHVPQGWKSTEKSTA